MLQYLLTYLQANEEGQDLVEYALIIVLVILGAALVLPGLADVLIDLWYNRVIVAFG
jgi:Flp pilus assembly pilin Flp